MGWYRSSSRSQVTGSWMCQHESSHGGHQQAPRAAPAPARIMLPKDCGQEELIMRMPPQIRKFPLVCFIFARSSTERGSMSDDGWGDDPSEEDWENEVHPSAKPHASYARFLSSNTPRSLALPVSQPRPTLEPFLCWTCWSLVCQ